MAIKSTELQELARRAAHELVLLDRPPLGHVEALVCRLIADLGTDEASGLGIVRRLCTLADGWVDPALIYMTLGRLQDPKECIRHVRTIPQRRGPPMKTYALTAKGREALERTTAHHRALARVLLHAKPYKPAKAQPQGNRKGSGHARREIRGK